MNPSLSTPTPRAAPGERAWLERALGLVEGGTKHWGTAALFAVVVVPLLMYFLLAGGAFDFDCYWVGSWAVRDGKAAQMYAALDAPNERGFYDLGGHTPEWKALAAAYLERPQRLWAYIYPPPCAALFLPMTYLPREAAVVLWRLLNLGSYLAGVLLLLRLTYRRLTPTVAQTLVFLMLASPPLLAALALGQITPMVVGTMMAGLYFLQTKRPALAGFFLGVGTLLKVSPILFIVWLLARRQFRAAVVSVITIIGLSGVTALVTGTEVFTRFLTHCLPLLSRGALSNTNLSAVGLVGRTLSLGPARSSFLLPPDMRMTLFKLAFYGIALAVSVGALWLARHAEEEERERLEYANINMLALLVSPITWGHHLLAALLTLFILVTWAIPRRQWGMVAACGVAYALMLQSGDLPWRQFPIPVGAALAFAGMAALWVISCVSLARLRGEPA